MTNSDTGQENTISSKPPDQDATATSGRNGRARPLLDTRVRLRHTALIGAFTAVGIALVLAVVRIGSSLAPSHWPGMLWLVSAVMALLLFTPLVVCVAGHLVLMRRGPRLWPRAWRRLGALGHLESGGAATTGRRPGDRRRDGDRLPSLRGDRLPGHAARRPLPPHRALGRGRLVRPRLLPPARDPSRHAVRL